MPKKNLIAGGFTPEFGAGYQPAVEPIAETLNSLNAQKLESEKAKQLASENAYPDKPTGIPIRNKYLNAMRRNKVDNRKSIKKQVNEALAQYLGLDEPDTD